MAVFKQLHSAFIYKAVITFQYFVTPAKLALYLASSDARVRAATEAEDWLCSTLATFILCLSISYLQLNYLLIF